MFKCLKALKESECLNGEGGPYSKNIISRIIFQKGELWDISKQRKKNTKMCFTTETIQKEEINEELNT